MLACYRPLAVGKHLPKLGWIITPCAATTSVPLGKFWSIWTQQQIHCFLGDAPGLSDRQTNPSLPDKMRPQQHSSAPHAFNTQDLSPLHIQGSYQSYGQNSTVRTGNVDRSALSTYAYENLYTNRGKLLTAVPDTVFFLLSQGNHCFFPNNRHATLRSLKFRPKELDAQQSWQSNSNRTDIAAKIATVLRLVLVARA